MSGFRIEGAASGNVAEVDGYGGLRVGLSTIPQYMGGIRTFSEIDPGLATGIPYLTSPEVDDDFRLRVSNDVIFDEESLVYTTQNFTKHYMGATTYVPSFTNTGFNTNPTNLLTAGAAVVFKTNKTFSISGTETLALDVEGSFNWASGASIPTNVIIELGFGLSATTTPYDTFDGVYMRATNAGVVGVIRNNSATDTVVSGIFNDYTANPWVPANGRKYQFIIYINPRSVEFWINDPVADIVWLAKEIMTPAGFGAPTASPALPVWLRQYQQNAPTIAASFNLARYNVRRGGANLSTTVGTYAARAMESILAPGTLTTTANQTITTGSITRPTAAVPTNTAALVTSLSGMVLELGTLAVGTDGILMAYQCPALPTTTGTSYAPNRRLRIDGLNIASSVQTAFATGGYSAHFYLAYGSTSVSLAGVAADTATTKAYRRVQLPIVQALTSATQAAGTLPAGNAAASVVLQNPIYVNPGEFVALVTYHLGTAGTTGVMQHAISFDYTWE